MKVRALTEKAFHFEEVRPVPYTVWYDRQSEEKLDIYFGGNSWKDPIKNALDRYLILWEPAFYLAPDMYRDFHGTLWKKGTPVHIADPALAEPDLRGFVIPDYTACLSSGTAEHINHSHGLIPSFTYEKFKLKFCPDPQAPFRIAGYGPGVFERAWMIRGYENFMMDLATEPGFSADLLDMVTARQVDLLKELCRLPIDGILFADDWGDQRGITIGPELWRKFIKPRVKKLYDTVHDAGKLTVQHTCGNVFPIIPDMIEIGLDCLQSLQPETMPVYEIKKLYGRDLVLWGGLGTQELLTFGTPERIRKEAEKLKTELGRGGGYIFSSSKPIMNDVPIENAVALIEASIRDDL
jgi:uroporphyrinogen decarboxylase